MSYFSTPGWKAATRTCRLVAHRRSIAMRVTRLSSTLSTPKEQINSNRSRFLFKTHIGSTKPAPSSAFAFVKDDLDTSYDTAEPTFAKQPGSKIFTYDKLFPLQLGDALPKMDVCYETWGKLNSDRSNAILLHTGLSAHTHAASNEENPNTGWWEKFIGPGKTLDTNKYFVVCCNVLGSCYGSTGPSSLNPDTNAPYGSDFPSITVNDMVRAQFHLIDSLGISSLHASVGSSLGAMQSLTAGALFNDRVRRIVSISGACRSHPSSIALRYAQRQAIVTDPYWQDGHYYGTGRFPNVGMKTARLISTISYRSGPEWEYRFGNRKLAEQVPAHQRSFGPEFLIENYIDYQGEKFSTRYDPNSILYISKAMDLFDMSHGFANMEESLSRISAPTLVLGVQSDILFPAFQQKEIADILKKVKKCPVTYFELDSLYGHDTFLVDVDTVGSAVRGHIDNEY